MKFAAFALALGLAASSTAQAGAVYDYAYTFNNGHKVTGSFSGERSGDLITHLTGVTVAVDGVDFMGSGTFDAFGLDATGQWVTGAGVVSLDGLSNNFLVGDTYAPGVTPASNLFYMATTIPVPEVYAAWNWGNMYLYDRPYFGEGWTVTQRRLVPDDQQQNAGHDVPEPGSLALLGAGLLATAALRRRRA